MNDEPELELEAASAAVDGLATAEERALVESSPALRADVERFTEVRERMRDVVVPTAARESAIAAALAAFDEAAQPAAAPTAHEPRPNVVSLASRRRRQLTFLGAAAAVVAVVAAAAVAIGGGRNDDGESVSLATTAPAVLAEPPVVAATDSQRTIEEDAADEQPDDGAGAGEDEVTSAAESMPAADLPAGAPFPAETDDEFVLSAPTEVTPHISSVEELRDYVVEAKFSDAADSAPQTESTEAAADTTADVESSSPAPATSVETADTDSAPELDPLQQCVSPDTALIGTVIYRNEPAFVLEVIETGEILALATSDCTLLAVATP